MERENWNRTQYTRREQLENTKYTKTSIRSVIQKLKEFIWDHEIETELREIWKYAKDENLRLYLLEVEFPSCACKFLTHYNPIKFKNIEHSRLREVLIGIIADIINVKCKNELTFDDLNVILNLLGCTESKISVQVFKFFSAYIPHSENFRHLIQVKKDSVIEIFNTTLERSEDLSILANILPALAEITEVLCIEGFATIGMFKNALKACIKLMNEDELNYDVDLKGWRSVTHLMKYAENCSIYIDVGIARMNENFAISFTDFFLRLSEWYTAQETLIPPTQTIYYYFNAANNIFRNLNYCCCGQTLMNLILAINILLDNNYKDIDSFAKVCCYFMEKESAEAIKEFLSPLRKKIVSKVLKYLIEYGYDIELSKINELL